MEWVAVPSSALPVGMGCVARRFATGGEAERQSTVHSGDDPELVYSILLLAGHFVVGIRSSANPQRVCSRGVEDT